MLKFTVEISIQADKWENEYQKGVFMDNVEDIIQDGLYKMTVGDWKAKVIEAREEK